MFLYVLVSANNFQVKRVLLRMKNAVEYLLKAGKCRGVFGGNGKIEYNEIPYLIGKARFVAHLSVSLTL